MMLDALVPVSESPTFQVLSSTSVKLFLPNLSSITKPVITGFRIIWSQSLSELHGPFSSTQTVSVIESQIIDNLLQGSTYYFAVCLIGEREEGIFSVPVWIPLSCKYLF